MIDLRKNKKVSMNRQPLVASSIFADRGANVKWPTFRKVYMNDQNVLARYVGKAPEERAVFFEYMVKEKDLKGAIFLLCWIGNFHNGCIFHAAPQYPQMNCWIETLGYEKATEFFERKSFALYKIISDILHEGKPIIDDEVREFVEKNG